MPAIQPPPSLLKMPEHKPVLMKKAEEPIVSPTNNVEKILDGMSLQLKPSKTPISNSRTAAPKSNSDANKATTKAKSALKIQESVVFEKKTGASSTVVVTNFSDFEVAEPSELKEQSIRVQPRSGAKDTRRKPQITENESKAQKPTESKPHARPAKKIDVPKEEFDFEAANLKFEKEKLAAQGTIHKKDSFFDEIPQDTNTNET